MNADALEDIPPTPMEDFGKGDEIFDVVEENPSFPGGIDKFRHFLGDNIIYPRMARDLGVQGRVVVQFVVEIDGSVTDIVVVRSLGNGTDEEAIRVLQKSPKWNPGKQHGKPVRVKYTVPAIPAEKKLHDATESWKWLKKSFS
jgi:protein TonB